MASDTKARLVCLFIGIIWAATPANAVPERPRLTMGAVLSLSGAQTALGMEARRGLELAHALPRERDPKLAARITLVTGDDQSTVGEARVATERLIAKDKAHVVIGTQVASSATQDSAQGLRTSLSPRSLPANASPEPTNAPVAAPKVRP